MFGVTIVMAHRRPLGITDDRRCRCLLLTLVRSRRESARGCTQTVEVASLWLCILCRSRAVDVRLLLVQTLALQEMFPIDNSYSKCSYHVIAGNLRKMLLRSKSGYRASLCVGSTRLTRDEALQYSSLFCLCKCKQLCGLYGRKSLTSIVFTQSGAVCPRPQQYYTV